MNLAETARLLSGEMALFAASGFLLFALDDLLVDILYFSRRALRSATVYRRHPRSFADDFAAGQGAQGTAAAPVRGWIAVLVPAWDESSVIAAMLRSTLARFDHPDFLLFVGHYRNDPATARAIAEVEDPRIVSVAVPVDGPTTKADCLNHLYDALVDEEAHRGERARAVVFHDAEDLVHPLELRLFDRLIDRAGAIQLPVLPLLDKTSPWIAGHYADEFAEAHGKELVVREAIGAAVPLAGVACALSRPALADLARSHGGRPFSPASLTEDYEMGLRLGALGYRTLFVRMPAHRGAPAHVASRGHFPATLGAAVRQKARWIGGIALDGWDRLGWRGGLAERWMRMRDRRGPLSALLMFAGYGAALLWAQLGVAAAFGAPIDLAPDPLLATLLFWNALLLGWRLAMRALFTGLAYGWVEGLRAIPRALVSNLIAILAALRAVRIHDRDAPKRWDKTDHKFVPEGGVA